MPELPEVQTVVSDLNKKIIGREITGAWFDWPSQISLYKTLEGKLKIIKKPAPRELVSAIKGALIERVERRGKNILIYLTRDLLLLIHQKMTGHLLVGKWKIFKNKALAVSPAVLKQKVNDYIHLIFYLDDGRMLGLSDLRKFAKVAFGEKKYIETLPGLIKLGPDALDTRLNFKRFQRLIGAEKRKIKQVLMDQEVLAGIGNIYSDDILWQAKVHPFQPANRLPPSDLSKIYSAMKIILKKAVRLRGTSISDFRDTAGALGKYADVRLVYRREGESCRRCRALIKRVKMNGRSAHFCPACQRL